MKILRTSYVLPRIILLILIYLFFFFAFDPILKQTIKYFLQSIFNAKVDIASVKTSFLNPQIKIEKLKVGDKDKEFSNLFEFDEALFKLNGRQLLEKKFIVENASVKGLKFNTPRKTSAKLTKKEKKSNVVNKTAQKLKKISIDKISEFKSDAVDKLKIEEENLESVKLIKDLKEKYEVEYGNIDKGINIKKYETQIKEIEELYKKLKKEKNFLKQVDYTSKLNKKIDNLEKEFNSDIKNIKNKISELKDYQKEIQQARKRDIEKLMSYAKIPEINEKNIAELLLGKSIYEKLDRYQKLFLKIKKYFPKNTQKQIIKEEKKRGRAVYFPKQNSYPYFLILKAEIDGIFNNENPINYKALLKDFTTQPQLYKKPLTVLLNGQQKNSSVKLNSFIYLYQNPTTSKTDFSYTNAIVSNIVFGDEKFIQVKINKAYVDTNFTFKTEGNKIDLNYTSKFKNAKVESIVNITPFINDTLKNAIDRIDSFSVYIKAEGEIENPSLKLTTDLAHIISKLLEKSFKNQIDDSKKKLEARLNSIISEYTKELDKLINQKKEELNMKLNKQQEEFNKWQNEIVNSLKKKNKLPRF